MVGGGGGGLKYKTQWQNAPPVRLELSVVQIHAIKLKIIFAYFNLFHHANTVDMLELQKNILHSVHFNECIQVPVQFSISIYPFL